MNAQVTEREPLTAMLRTIFERRSIRKYKDVPVSKELLEVILDAARMAPSALNRQPWKFYVLTERKSIELFSKEIWSAAQSDLAASGLKNRLKNVFKLLHFIPPTTFLHRTDHVFHGAPAVIFITSPAGDEWGGLDIGMCAQNLMLAAKSLGLDSCPIGFARYVVKTNSYRALGISPKEQVQLAVIVGYGDEVPKIRERSMHNTMFITWDGRQE